jgi:hypothetical protein
MTPPAKQFVHRLPSIEGEMSGADQLAREWAEDRGVDVDPYPADWDNIERPGAVVKRNCRGKARM